MKNICPKCNKKITQDDSRSWDSKGYLYCFKCALNMPKDEIEEIDEDEIDEDEEEKRVKYRYGTEL